MTPLAASAPGKIVVAGEYAVLSGAPAVSMAVGRRARVSLGPVDGDTHRLTTRGFRNGSWRFAQRGDSIDWLDALPQSDAMALFETVLAETGMPPVRACAVTIDSSEFFDPASRRKLGLGSSAAVAVALAAALSPGGGHRVAAAAHAARAHRHFQEGRGSGVDVATAIAGGLIIYTRGHDPEPVDWPEGLEFELLWSGREASTSARIAALDGPADDAGRALAVASAEAAAAWRQGGAEAVLESMQSFVASLIEFDRCRHLGILGAGHAGLVTLAGELPGVVYKPCGAGGGDAGVALAIDGRALRAFVDRAEACGFTRLDAAIDPRGVQAETVD